MHTQDGTRKPSKAFHDLSLIAISLVITTILGGFLGHYFQTQASKNQHELQLLADKFQHEQQLRAAEIQYEQQLRAAEIQHEQKLREAEIAAARDLFEDLSTLMDRRLYRTRLLIWGYQTGASQERMNERSESYREVLFDWNERINRNFVLAEAYFGKELRLFLEEDIATGFRRLHETLDSFKRAKKTDRAAARAKSEEANLLNVKISKCNLFMIKRIRDGEVGRFLRSENGLTAEQPSQTDN